MKKYFNKNDLKLKDFQYQVSYDTTLNFRIGDTVFLKSSPDVPLKVVGIDSEKIHCKFDNGFIIVKPQMILHYKYAGLLSFKRKHIINK